MRKTVIVLSFVLCVCGCTEYKNTQLAESVDRLCLEIFEENGPGAEVIVIKDGEVFFDKGYGYSDIQAKIPFNGDTFLPVGDISKLFTSTAVLQLVSDGKIDLEKPVSFYLPELKSDVFKKVKVSNLLNHSSGLPDMRRYLMRDQRIKSDEITSTEFFFDIDELLFEPGTCYDYQDPTYILLGGIIERVTGVGFDRYMTENVFRKAGMADTWYFGDIRHAHDTLAKAYYPEEDVWEERKLSDVEYGRTKPDRSLVSSAYQLLKWVKAYENNEVLPSEYVDMARMPMIMTAGSRYCNYQNAKGTWTGLSWFVREAMDGMPECDYLPGQLGEYKTIVARYPERKVSILIVSNYSRWDRMRMITGIESIIFDGN